MTGGACAACSRDAAGTGLEVHVRFWMVFAHCSARVVVSVLIGLAALSLQEFIKKKASHCTDLRTE